MGKLKPAARKPLLEVAVQFGSLNLGKRISLPLNVSRADLAIGDAMRYLHSVRLDGKILARPEGAGARQPGLFAGDGDVTMTIQCDVNGLGINGSDISARLIFAWDIDTAESLGDFPGREGILTIFEVRELPKESTGVAEDQS